MRVHDGYLTELSVTELHAGRSLTRLFYLRESWNADLLQGCADQGVSLGRLPHAVAVDAEKQAILPGRVTTS